MYSWTGIPNLYYSNSKYIHLPKRNSKYILPNLYTFQVYTSNYVHEIPTNNRVTISFHLSSVLQLFGSIYVPSIHILIPSLSWYCNYYYYYYYYYCYYYHYYYYHFIIIIVITTSQEPRFARFWLRTQSSKPFCLNVGPNPNLEFRTFLLERWSESEPPKSRSCLSNKSTDKGSRDSEVRIRNDSSEPGVPNFLGRWYLLRKGVLPRVKFGRRTPSRFREKPLCRFWCPSASRITAVWTG